MKYTQCDCWYCQTCDRLVALFPAQEEAIKDAIADSQTGLDQDLEDSILMILDKLARLTLNYRDGVDEEIQSIRNACTVDRFPGWEYDGRFLAVYWDRRHSKGRFSIFKLDAFNSACLHLVGDHFSGSIPCDNPSQAHRLAEAIVENSKLRWVE